MRSSKSIRSRFKSDSGFTLIEVLISMFILTIGLLSLLGVFGLAMSGTMTAQEDRIAKQLAQDAYESIYTARDTANVPWVNENVSGGGTGIFVSGFQPIYQSGAMPSLAPRMMRQRERSSFSWLVRTEFLAPPMTRLFPLRIFSGKLRLWTWSMVDPGP